MKRRHARSPDGARHRRHQEGTLNRSLPAFTLARRAQRRRFPAGCWPPPSPASRRRLALARRASCNLSGLQWLLVGRPSCSQSRPLGGACSISVRRTSCCAEFSSEALGMGFAAGAVVALLLPVVRVARRARARWARHRGGPALAWAAGSWLAAWRYSAAHEESPARAARRTQLVAGRAAPARVSRQTVNGSRPGATTQSAARLLDRPRSSTWPSSRCSSPKVERRAGFVNLAAIEDGDACQESTPCRRGRAG
jgi:hypothetical protein